MNKFRTLTAREIECRIAQVKPGKGLQLLLYKDARCDQNILDETVGPMNWQRHHSRDNANCTVSIWDEEKGQWISKEDTGTESNTEAEKGLASDSFKRACVNWGIGRELYTSPFIWINASDCNIEGNRCNDRFDVVDVAYTESREICGLRIKNEKSGRIVFDMNKKKEPEPPKEPPKEPQKPSVYYECGKCHKVVKGLKSPDGAVISAMQYDTRCRKKFGQTLCWNCVKELYPDAAADTSWLTV